MSNVWTHRLLGIIGAPQAGSEPSPAPSNEPKFKRPFVEGPSVAELYQGIQAKIEAIRTSDEGRKIISEYQLLNNQPASYLNTILRKEAYHKLEGMFRTAFAEELEACVTKELSERPRRDPEGLTPEERNELTPKERREFANAVKVYNRDPNHPLSDASYEKQLRDRIESITQKHQLTYSISEDTKSDPRYCADWIKQIIHQQCEDLKLDAPELMSGPFHDALALSYACDYGMIFVRCKDGISHNPLEFASYEDLALGAEVMLSTVVGILKR